MSITRSGFQSVVNAQPAPAEAGDFAGSNPRMSVNMGPGGGVADPAGVYVGRFAYYDPATGNVTNANVANTLQGFVHRENQAIIVPFLGASALQVQGGFPMTLMSRGDFWASFAAGGAIGDRVYADPVTGQASTSSGGGNIATPFYLATDVPIDASVTASIAAATGIMTVSAVGSGVLAVGQVITGTGIPADSFITAQLTGSAGSTGTYATNVRKLVTSTTVVASQGHLGKITTWQG
jgi:hypothetical protein